MQSVVDQHLGRYGKAVRESMGALRQERDAARNEAGRLQAQIDAALKRSAASRRDPERKSAAIGRAY